MQSDFFFLYKKKRLSISLKYGENKVPEKKLNFFQKRSFS